MYKTMIPLAVVAAMSIAGCSSLERSRNLNDARVSGTTLAQQVCSLCHGNDGNSVSPVFPNLAGQQKAYLVTQLTNFRGHDRSDPAGFEYMWGLSRHLTDNQINELADYFAKQAPARPSAIISDEKLLAEGKRIFEEGLPAKEAPPCMACHGPKGEGLESFPRLAYQHEDYVMKQLLVFQRTDERPNTPMTQIAHALSAQEIKAITAYLQAFPNDN